MPSECGDGSFQFHASELRRIQSGETPYHQCPDCNGSGFQNYDENGCDVQPGRTSAPDRENGICETCGEAGIVPGVGLTKPIPITTPKNPIHRLSDRTCLDVSEILHVSRPNHLKLYTVTFKTGIKVEYWTNRVPHEEVLKLWEGFANDK